MLIEPIQYQLVANQYYKKNYLVLYVKSRELSLKQVLVKRKSKYYLAGQEISEKKFYHQTFQKVTLNRSFSKIGFSRRRKKFFFRKMNSESTQKNSQQRLGRIYFFCISIHHELCPSPSRPLFSNVRKKTKELLTLGFLCWYHELKSFFGKLAPSSFWTNSDTRRHALTINP